MSSARQLTLNSFFKLQGFLFWAWVAAAALIPLQAAHSRANGPVVLTLTGNVGVQGKTGVVEFKLADLQALKQQTFTTSTPWDPRPVKFSGPLLRDVLDVALAKGLQLSATAVNDYSVTLPMEDAVKFDPILAIKLDDRDIPVRTRGPIFLIYPFSRLPELNKPTFHARSIWQVKAIKVH